jgi:Flp pilus assembly protein TadD
MPDSDRTHGDSPDVGPATEAENAELTGDFTIPVAQIPEASTAPAPPPQKAGRYAILAEIARGGMGVVYRAHDPSVNRDVAVKVLKERFRYQPTATGRFLEEGQITGQLQHPGIPAVHEIGSLPDGSPFLAMKLIRGVTLAERLAEPFPDRGRLVAVFLQVAQAVGYAHSKGVIHRDLKPANVMVGQFGEVQVMDWGLAKVLAKAGPEPEQAEAPSHDSIIETDRSADLGTATQAGDVLGTPAFMSPEQAGGEVGRVDERADVFGLGALLCAILTGAPPFQDTTTSAVHLRAVRGQVEDAYARLDECGADPELVALCKRCLAPDREARPRNAGEVAAAVSASLAAVEDRLRRAERERAAAEAKAAEEVNTRRLAEEKAAEQRKRRRAQRALLLCLVLLLFGGGAVAWWFDLQAAERRADVLRRLVEDKQRAQEEARRAAVEQQRLARNAQAMEFLLGQCEDALRNDDADKAANALSLARQRDADGGGDHLRPRLARCSADLTMLRDLDRAEDLRWTAQDGRLQTEEAKAETDKAFRRFGIVPGQTPPAEAARRVNESLIRDRLLLALDQWLFQTRSPAVLALLHAADPDPFRADLRTAFRARNLGRMRELASRPEMFGQPASFIAVLGQWRAIAADRRQQILQDAVRRRPGNFPVLMTLANSIPADDKARAEKKAGWYRAALAVRPSNAAAWNNLGVVLVRQEDLDGAIAAYREAIRLHPHRAPKPNYNLGLALRKKGDLGGAIAAYREAVRLDPKYIAAWNSLGVALREQGDLEGAITAFRETIRIDPKYALGHSNLGLVLRDKGDLDGAVAAFQEAVRLDPKTSRYQTNLRQTERWVKLLPQIPDIAAGRAEPRNSADALALARVCQQPFQRRYALAVRLAAAAFDADKAPADNLTAGHRYRAAVAAVRAAAGKDFELTAFGVEEWSYFTGMALKWLREDLALRKAQAKDPKTSSGARTALTNWKKNPDLAAVRDAAWLAALPPADRKAWQSLWADVDAVLASIPPPG